MKLNMKKLALTFAIVLGITMSSFAQGGLFQYGAVSDEDYYYGTAWYALNQNNEFQQRTGSGLLPGLPYHDETTNQDAPLGGGALLLIGFGAAYALKKRNKA